MKEILIVEKDYFYSNILATLLKYHGYGSQKCNHPEYLHELLNSKSFDILLVNLQDEAQDMIYALNRIDQFDTNIILMSNYYDYSLENEPFFPLIYAYLIKPKGMVHLKTVIEQITQGFTLEKNLVDSKSNQKDAYQQSGILLNTERTFKKVQGF